MSNHARRRRRRPTSSLVPVPDGAGADDCSCCAACRGMTHEELDAVLLERVAARGHAVQPVLGDTLAESWAYTVGLGFTYGLPELLVTGMRAADAVGLLDVLVDEFGLDGLPAPGRGLKHRIELRDHGHEFCLLTVDSDLVYRSSLLATATCLADVLGPPCGAVQVVLCDGRGRMPWEVGCRNPDATMLLDHPLESVRRRFP